MRKDRQTRLGKQLTQIQGSTYGKTQSKAKGSVVGRPHLWKHQCITIVMMKVTAL
jgi:hypothetical protein